MFMHKIRLKNILSFGPDAQELELKPLNVLIGPNGSGKSNLIEAIGLLQAAPGDLQEPIREGGGVRNWIWKGGPNETIAEMEVVISPSGNRRLRYRLSFHEDNQQFRLHGESLCPESVDANTDPIPYFDSDADRVYLLIDDSRQETGKSTIEVKHGSSDQSVFASFKGPKYPELTHVGKQFQHIRLFREWAFGRHARLRLPQTADLSNDFFMEDGSNFGLVLNSMKIDYPRAKDQLLNALSQLYENIVDFGVSVEGGTVQVFLQEGGITVPATRLSDGTLRYLGLLAVLCHPEPPPLICIEEPELGLHPDILPGLAELLREASERCQLIVTTHSEVIVDALTDTPESVVVCEKKDGQTTLRRLSEDGLAHWLKSYRLGELWSSGELGGNRW